MKLQLFDLLEHAEIVVIDGVVIDHFRPRVPAYECWCGDDHVFGFQPAEVTLSELGTLRVHEIHSDRLVTISFRKSVPMRLPDFHNIFPQPNL